MCCFSRKVESVTNTNIFARDSKSPMQFLVYSMNFSAAEDLAMILPIPVPKGTAEKGVRFINLEKYPDFFAAMDRGFPKPGFVAAAPAGGVGKKPLEVVDVGAFEASFVPTVNDFGRLDERFRLPAGTWDKLPQYKAYGFAVFKLKQGNHEYRLEYFQAAAHAELFAAWRGPGFTNTPLSQWLHPGWKDGAKSKKKNENTGMPLVVAQEPIVYRNFIAGAGNRGIGVGYPGNANIAWSAEHFGLAVAWRGAFIDAARHWGGRGGGAQLPLGFDVIRPVGEASLPFAINPAPGSVWPTVPKGERAEGYAWKGYELDAKRHPTFHYEWQGVKVSERYEVEGDAFAGAGRLVRVLKLDGKLPAGAVLRVASGEIKPMSSGFAVNGGKFSLDGREFENVFQVAVHGATVAGKDLLVPLRAEIKVSYSWPAAHSQHAHAK